MGGGEEGGREGEEGGARGSVVDESRVSTAKVPVTPHPRVPALRTAPEKLTDFQFVVRNTSGTETIRKPRRHNLNDDDASLCGEQGEEPAFDEPPEFQRGDPVLSTVSWGSVGSSHARRARVAQRPTPPLHLTGS